MPLRKRWGSAALSQGQYFHQNRSAAACTENQQCLPGRVAHTLPPPSRLLATHFMTLLLRSGAWGTHGQPEHSLAND